ncbi:MAG: ATP-binding cassette domain-containing protein [Lachnospiraceae bacterium]|nr:ATP-binding cassette domain-containing protein [Lachnospiraceae bacterium]
MSETVIKIENLKKQYRLGTIGGRTLNAELQSWWARKRRKEDPNLRIGEERSDYGKPFWALKGIDLEVKKGEALGIIGANGAGKSTFLKILSRVTAPTEGDIWLNGRVASMLEVGTGFHGELTGRENIYMNGAILGMTKKEVDRKIESIIDFSECREFIDTPVKRYSSGMYVKLAFAVASHLDAEIMVMDEVLAVGDMKFQKKCLGRMGDEARSGRTVLYVSHNMATIRNLCTRCIVLDKGALIFDGNVEEAIGVYRAELVKDDLLLRIECKDMLRRNRLGMKSHISTFEFCDVDIPEYLAGDTMLFSVYWYNPEQIRDAIARITIKTAEDELIATSESQIMHNVGSGDHITRFRFNTKNLVDGMYKLVFSISEINEFAQTELLDEIPQVISFRIIEKDLYKNQKARWIKSYWGNIRLDPMTAEDITV